MFPTLRVESILRTDPCLVNTCSAPDRFATARRASLAVGAAQRARRPSNPLATANTKGWDGLKTKSGLAVHLSVQFAIRVDEVKFVLKDHTGQGELVERVTLNIAQADANIAEQKFTNGQIFLTTKRNRVDRRSGRDLPNVVLQLFEFFAQVLLSNALLVHRPRRSIARERSAREENHHRCHLQHQGVLFKALENGVQLLVATLARHVDDRPDVSVEFACVLVRRGRVLIDQFDEIGLGKDVALPKVRVELRARRSRARTAEMEGVRSDGGTRRSPDEFREWRFERWDSGRREGACCQSRIDVGRNERTERWITIYGEASSLFVERSWLTNRRDCFRTR